MNETPIAAAKKLAQSPVFWLLALASLLLCGLFSFSFGFFFLCFLVLATAMQAVLFLGTRPQWPVLLALPSLFLSYVVTGGFSMLLPVASCTAGGLLVAHLLKKGESRSGMARGLLALYALAFFAALLIPFVSHMVADGAQDVLAYLDRTLEGAVDTLATNFLTAYTRMADLYANMDVAFVIPTLEEIRETLLFGLSIGPAFFLCLCALPAIAVTYAVQLVGLCAGCRLLEKKNRIYRPSALLAGSYLVALPFGLLWGDFRDIFCFVCLNLVVFLTPVMAFGTLLQAPRLFAFMRRMSIGALDFSFFLILLIVFFLSNLLYMLLALAAAYAIYLLKSRFFPKKANG